MIAKRTIPFLLFTLLALGAFAADFAAAGYTQTGSRTEDGIAWTVLSDGTGEILLAAASVDPSPERLNALKTLVGAMRDWEGLAIGKIRATNDPAQLKVTFIPQSFVIAGSDLTPALPGGLVFWYDRTVEYDFRVKSGAYALRLTGIYSSAADLQDSIKLAWQDPVAWLLQRDPQYAIKKITDIAIKTEGISKDLGTTQENLAATGKDLGATKEELAATKAELAATKDELASTKTELAATQDAAKTEAETSASVISRLETALMTSLNYGLFTGAKPVSPESLEWVLAKKAENPAMTKAELLAASKAEKTKLTEKELNAILLVKFGER